MGNTDTPTPQGDQPEVQASTPENQEAAKTPEITSTGEAVDAADKKKTDAEGDMKKLEKVADRTKIIEIKANESNIFTKEKTAELEDASTSPEGEKKTPKTYGDKLSDDIDSSFKELENSKTPAESLAALGKLLAAIFAMIRRATDGTLGDSIEDDKEGTKDGDQEKGSESDTGKDIKKELDEQKADTPAKKKKALEKIEQNTEKNSEKIDEQIGEINKSIDKLQGKKKKIDDKIQSVENRITDLKQKGKKVPKRLKNKLNRLNKKSEKLGQKIKDGLEKLEGLKKQKEQLPKKAEKARKMREDVEKTENNIRKVEEKMEEVLGVNVVYDEGQFVVQAGKKQIPKWARGLLAKMDSDGDPENNQYVLDPKEARWLSETPVDLLEEKGSEEKDEKSPEDSSVDTSETDADKPPEDSAESGGEQVAEKEPEDEVNPRGAEFQEIADNIPTGEEEQVAGGEAEEVNPRGAEFEKIAADIPTGRESLHASVDKPTLLKEWAGKIRQRAKEINERNNDLVYNLRVESNDEAITIFPEEGTTKETMNSVRDKAKSRGMYVLDAGNDAITVHPTHWSEAGGFRGDEHADSELENDANDMLAGTEVASSTADS